MVLLNSDTLVTPGWLQRLVDCALARPQGGVFGPLSNAAMFQSIPHLKDKKGRWVVNALPPGVDLQAYAAAIATAGEPLYPEVRFINGFCYMISRAALDRVGLFDEETFPQGYGEEDDFSLRAYKAGFTLHVADNAYVFHAKSQSYSDARREEILVATKDSLRNKHSPEPSFLRPPRRSAAKPLLKSRVRAILAAEAITRQASQHLLTGSDRRSRLGDAAARRVWVRAAVPWPCGAASPAAEPGCRCSSPATALRPRRRDLDAVALDFGRGAAPRDPPRLPCGRQCHRPRLARRARRICPKRGRGHAYRRVEIACREDQGGRAPDVTIAGIVTGGVDPTLFRPLSCPIVYDVCFGGSLRGMDVGTTILLQASLGFRQLALADVDAPADQLAGWIAQGRIFVASEPSPVSAVEAMACGVPVIVPDDSSACEYAQNEVNALIVPARDADALRAAIARLTINRVPRRRLIEGGMRTAWEHDCGETATKILDLIAGRSAAAPADAGGVSVATG